MIAEMTVSFQQQSEELITARRELNEERREVEMLRRQLADDISGVTSDKLACETQQSDINKWYVHTYIKNES